MLDLSRQVLGIDMTAVGRKARMLPPAVLRVLRLFDGVRNMAEAIDQSSLETSLAIAVVRRLVKQGVLKPVLKGTRAMEVPPVSPALWQWFASPVMETQPAPKESILREYRLTTALAAALDTTLEDGRARSAQPNREPPLFVVHVGPECSLERDLEKRFPDAGRADDEKAEPLEVGEEPDRHPGMLLEIKDRVVTLNVRDGSGSFTTEELEFFESYQPEVQDEDTFGDLVGDPSGGP